MKRLPLIVLVSAWFCLLPVVAQATVYRYDFIPTEVSGLPLYPLSYYTGSYLDLTAPSGSGVDYSAAIADWHLVTGQGVLDNANSSRASYGGTPTLSWNSSTISSVAGTLVFSGSGPSVWVTDTFESASYYMGNNTFQSDSVYGYWQAEAVPVPEPSSFMLIGVLWLKRQCARRRPGG